MADLNLTLGVPSGDRTLSATPGNVRRIKLPLGTRTYLITSESAFYIEEDASQAKLDEAASDTTKRHKFVAGSYPLTPIGAGMERNSLPADRFIYVVGTVASQPYWITPVGERGT
jgi:hypothetical protein